MSAKQPPTPPTPAAAPPPSSVWPIHLAVEAVSVFSTQSDSDPQVLNEFIPPTNPVTEADFHAWNLWTSQQDRRISHRMRSARTFERVCSGDGNCFFRAVSVQLYGDETHHLELRCAVVAYLRVHRHLFNLFMLYTDAELHDMTLLGRR